MKNIVFLISVLVINSAIGQDFTPTKSTALRVSMENNLFYRFLKKAKAEKNIKFFIGDWIDQSDTLIDDYFIFKRVDALTLECLNVGDLVLSKKSSFRIMYDYSKKSRIGNKEIVYTLGMYFEFKENKWVLTSHTLIKDRFPIK